MAHSCCSKIGTASDPSSRPHPCKAPLLRFFGGIDNTTVGGNGSHGCASTSTSTSTGTSGSGSGYADTTATTCSHILFTVPLSLQRLLSRHAVVNHTPVKVTK